LSPFNNHLRVVPINVVRTPPKQDRIVVKLAKTSITANTQVLASLASIMAMV